MIDVHSKMREKHLLEWYNVGPEERARCGELGRQWVLNDGRMTAKHLSESFIKI